MKERLQQNPMLQDYNMITRITKHEVAMLAAKNGYEYAMLQAVNMVEGSGIGFSPVTGRIIIQFEPLWFKRECQEWKDHVKGQVWLNNGVENQTKEWEAFNNAFSIDSDAAMQSTSIGIMQVMGFHYELLKFKKVGEMWDYAKVSEANQLDLGIRFIKSNPKMDMALKRKDWATFAYYYNGAGYKQLAIALREKSYDLRLDYAYNRIIKSPFAV